MKTRLLILFIIFAYSSKAKTFDSLLFATDGKYVLFKDHDAPGLLNGCLVEIWELYTTGNYKREIVAIYQDSAYLLSYSDHANDRPIFKTTECLTDAHITNRYTLTQFLMHYKLTLNAYQSSEPITIKVDTIRSYKKKEFDKEIKWYDLAIKLIFKSIPLQTDTISTNFPDDIHFKSSAYKLYFSTNDNFIFLNGVYSVGSTDLDAYVSETRVSRLLTKNYR
jgi:hypothetical protein